MSANRALCASAVVSLLAACGGGGGSSPGLTLSLSTHSITFTVADQNSPRPASQIVGATVTGTASGTLYVLVFPSDPTMLTVGDFSITSASTGQATVTPASPSTVGIGAHTSTITVRACLNAPTCATGEIAGSPQIVDVSYVVPGIFVAPSSPLSFSIGNPPLAADLSRQVTVTGAPSQNWTATADVPWLSLVPASGNASAPVQITASLPQPQVDALNNGTYRGSVTIRPTSGLPISIPVSLTISRTQINDVAPYLAFTGSSAEVIIRGDNLDQITVDGVTFGDHTATSFRLVSATEVRAVHPTLAAGAYPIRLQNRQGFDRSLATLVVVDAPVYAATTLSYPVAPNPFEPFGFAYDAERRALVVTRRTQTFEAPSVLLRYQFSSSGWSAPTEVAVPGIRSVALSVDGSQWLAGTEAAQDAVVGFTRAGIVLVRAADLLVGAKAQSSLNPSDGAYLRALAPANDGSVLAFPQLAGVSLTSGLRFSVRDFAFSSLGTDLVFGGVAASADGSRVLFGSALGDQIYEYDASTATFATRTIDFAPVIRDSPALNRTGSRFVLNDCAALIGGGTVRVFDEFTALGDLPTSTIAAVLSPDGSKAYTLDTSGKLRTFDISSVPFSEVAPAGGIALAGSPGAPNIGSDGFGIKMLMSPDGGTIFLAGGDRIVVQPVP